MKVSVIITPWARSAAQALSSVLAQTLADIEIIVVDEGASDSAPGTPAACPDHIRHIQPSHPGRLAARAAGVQASQGDYLSFLNADDLIPPGKLERQAEQLDARPELGLVYFGGQIEAGEATHIIREIEPNGPVPDSPAAAIEFLLSGCPLIRRDCIGRAGLFDPRPDSGDAESSPWDHIFAAGYAIDPVEQSALCKEHIMLFLQRLDQGEARAGRRHMVEAVKLAPFLLETPEIFIQSVLGYARRLDVADSVTLVQSALDNLPACARQFERLRSRTLAELFIGRAFQDHTLGHMSQARRDILAGLSHDASLLRNRGVVSVFLKSFFSFNGTHGGRNTEPDRLRWVVKTMHKALGQSIDRIEQTTGGTNRNTYKLRIGGRPAVLRILEQRPDRLDLSQIIAVQERVRAAGVPAPEVLAYHLPEPGTPDRAWIAEEWMPGDCFFPQNMSWRDALSAAAELGACLRQLHSIETQGFGLISSERLEARYNTLDQWWAAKNPNGYGALAGIPSEALACIEAARNLIYETCRVAPRLCHGDCHAWNLLVNGGHLSAVIDWDKAHGSDPAFDVAEFYFWTDDEQILTAVLRAYTPAEPDMFRHRIAASVILMAAYLLATVVQRPEQTKQAIYRQCTRWLTDKALAQRLDV